MRNDKNGNMDSIKLVILFWEISKDNVVSITKELLSYATLSFEMIFFQSYLYKQ